MIQQSIDKHQQHCTECHLSGLILVKQEQTCWQMEQECSGARVELKFCRTVQYNTPIISLLTSVLNCTLSPSLAACLPLDFHIHHAICFDHLLDCVTHYAHYFINTTFITQWGNFYRSELRLFSQRIAQYIWYSVQCSTATHTHTWFLFIWSIFPELLWTGWLGGITVRASDLRSSGRGFDSRPGCYQAT